MRIDLFKSLSKGIAYKGSIINDNELSFDLDDKGNRLILSKETGSIYLRDDLNTNILELKNNLSPFLLLLKEVIYND